MHMCRERERGRLIVHCSRLGFLGRSISFGALPTAEYIDRIYVLIKCSLLVVRYTVKES